MDKPSPRTPHAVPFFKPSLDEQEERAVLEVLRSGWLTTGEVTLRFEREFARYVGASHALALNSATAGLHLSLEALGVGPGTHVVTSPYTFASTAEVARYLGAELAFVDVEEATNNLDVSLLEEKLAALRMEGKKASAVVPVHVAGRPCDMEGIRSLASRFGVPVVEDAAHAFPSRIGGRFIGTGTEAGVFSFYATKSITTGEGGMVVTENGEVARRIRVMRLHGIDRDVWNRYTSGSASWRYDLVAPGYKYNLTDLASAIGLAQLGKAEEFLRLRRRIVRRYLEGLSDCDFLRLPADVEGHSWHLFILRIRPELLSIDRDRFIEELRARGIGTSVHFIPLHLMTYYRERYGFSPDDFPVSLGNFQTAVTLPLFPSQTAAEADRVIEAVRETGVRFRR
jgi:dTDP-4-amino-4,6-dideoxygalactose transaminase